MELSTKKLNLLLISKADLLSWQQRWALSWRFHLTSLSSSMHVLYRLSWARYFSEKGIAAAFWSAQGAAKEETVEGDVCGGVEEEGEEGDGEEGKGEGEGEEGKEEEEIDIQAPLSKKSSADQLRVCPNLLSREKLLQLFMDISPVPGEGTVDTPPPPHPSLPLFPSPL